MTVVRRLVSLGLVLNSGAALAQRPATPRLDAADPRPIAPPPDSLVHIREPIARQPAPPAIARLPRGRPTVLPVDRYTIIASTTWSHDSATRTGAADAAFLRCTATLRIPGDTARSLLEADPWREFDAAAIVFPYVLVNVMPLDAPPVECGPLGLDAAHYLQRGALFTRTGIVNAESNITHVDLFVDSSFVPPALYGRVPVTAAGPAPATAASLKRVSPHQVRVYIPMDALDPRHGRFAAITLRIWSDSLPPIGIPIRSSITRALWYELVPWRIDRWRDALSGQPLDVPALSSPNDVALRAAVARYREGAIPDAAEQAAAWRALDVAKNGEVSSAGRGDLRRDRLIADVMIGGALAAAGDTTAARPFAMDALATAPCLVPTTSASGAYARLLTSARPEARCTSLPRSTIVRRGLLIPGGGHAVAGDRGHAVTVATLVTGAFVGAGLARWSASTRYDEYKQATSVEQAQTLYDDAAKMQNLAIGLAIGGAAAWLGDIGYAVLREKRHSARIRSEQSFGREQ